MGKMLMPVAELMDRLTILYLKKMIGKQDVDDEISKYRLSISDHLDLKCEKFDDWFTRLMTFNTLIWGLESAIRAGKENELGLEEVGRRAIKIREYNAQRVAIKKEIAEAFGQSVDKKTDHASC